MFNNFMFFTIFSLFILLVYSTLNYKFLINFFLIVEVIWMVFFFLCNYINIVKNDVNFTVLSLIVLVFATYELIIILLSIFNNIK